MTVKTVQAEDILDFLKDNKNVATILAGYKGGYQLSLSTDPQDQKPVIRLRLACQTKPRQIPSTVLVKGASVKVLTTTGFTPPVAANRVRTR